MTWLHDHEKTLDSMFPGATKHHFDTLARYANQVDQHDLRQLVIAHDSLVASRTLLNVALSVSRGHFCTNSSKLAFL